MSFVLDASCALPWCFRDDATPQTARLLALAGSQSRIYVPAHWPIELLNGLTRAARRGRLEEASIEQFLADLQDFEVYIDFRPMQEVFAECLPLIRLYQLSACDAAYLALAIRFQLPLITSDDKLRTAATLEGIALEI